MITAFTSDTVGLAFFLRLPLPWWLMVPLIAYWIVVAVLLITDDREPARTLTWLFVLLLLPLLGLFLFLFFGRDWKVITARRRTTEDFMEFMRAKMRPSTNATPPPRSASRSSSAIPPP